MAGINLAAGELAAIGPAEGEQIMPIARRSWGGQVQEVLGQDWAIG